MLWRIGVLLLAGLFLLPASLLAEPPRLNIQTAESNEGLRVMAVAPTGLGRQMKLAEGDIILKVNEIDTKTSKDLREALARIEKKTEMKIEIVILRKGERRTIEGVLKKSTRVEGGYVFLPTKK
jgi:S1-C subfamily serine protease